MGAVRSYMWPSSTEKEPDTEQSVVSCTSGVRSFSSACSWLGQRLRCSPVRLLMLGVDGSGKTAILYRLKLGELLPTISTCGFNVETLEINGHKVELWDVGDREKLRPLYKHYLPNAHGLIFVVDSAAVQDEYNIESTREILTCFDQAAANNDMPVLVFANKQDLPDAFPPEQVVDKLQLNHLLKSYNWSVIGTSAKDAYGIQQGVERLVSDSLLYKKKHGL